MPNLIRQIVSEEEFGSQTIRMTVTANERGPQGEKGEQGEAATIEAGQAYSVNPGDSPQVINTGTSSAAVFDFYIPKGAKGDTGPEGPPGRDGKDPVWGNIEGTLSNQADLQSALNSKQDSLIAGDNIELDNNTISATDTTYTAGSGLNLNGTQFSVDTSQIQPKLSAGSNIQINGDTISATDTTYSAGSGLNLNGTEFSVDTSTIQSKLTAGSNVQINGNTISATDTTYTAGNAITIDSGNNNAINAAIDPADFFTSTESTVSGTGSSITVNNTAELPLKSIQIGGDTTQQTYSGKNLINIYATPGWVGGSTTYSASNGVLTVSGNWFVGFLIDVEANTQYKINASIDVISGEGGKIRIYTGSKVWVTDNSTFNTGSNTSVYVVFYAGEGAAGESKYSNVQLEKGSTATSYEPYVGGIPAPNPDYPQTVNNVTGRQVVDVYDKNLFSKYTITSGYLVNRTDGNLTANASYGASDFIPVVAGQQYTFTVGDFNFWYTAVYDSNKQYIGYPNNDRTITIPDGGAYIRTSVYLSNLDTAQIKQGTTSTPYQTHQSYEVNLGKNLFDNSTPSFVASTATWTPTDTGGLISNTASFGDSVQWRFTLKAGEPYTFNANATQGSCFWFIRSFTDGTYSTVKTSIYNDLSGNAPTKTFIPDSPYIMIKFYSGSAMSDVPITNLQLELGSTYTSYSPYFTPIELCKIGTYQDYIYKSGSDWYLHKGTTSFVLDGTNGGFYSSWYYISFSNLGVTNVGGSSLNAFSPNFTAYNYATFTGDSTLMGMSQSSSNFIIRNTHYSDSAGYQTWLANTLPKVYYPLATPTDTQITNADLIAQLNALAGATTYDGQTVFTVTSENQLALLDITAYRNSLAGIKAAIRES